VAEYNQSTESIYLFIYNEMLYRYMGCFITGLSVTHSLSCEPKHYKFPVQIIFCSSHDSDFNFCFHYCVKGSVDGVVILQAHFVICWQYDELRINTIL
jgi:hypothetical protein